MCEKCQKECICNYENDSQNKGRFALSRTKPNKLSDLNASWMCSIVGTCLTLAELRKLQRRNKLVFQDGDLSDYDLHGYFVKAANTDKHISKAMQTLLERKFRLVWKRFALVDSVEELEVLWDEALANGDVAGPYWAVLAHPLLSHRLGDKVFGEVHMLSHLVGATNRNDLKAMRRNEVEMERIKEELDQARSDVWSRDRIIAGLRTEIDQFQRQDRIGLFSTALSSNSFTNIEAVVEGLREALLDADKNNRALQDALARKAKRIEHLEVERETLKRDTEVLEREMHVLENAVPTFFGQHCANDGGVCFGEEACPYDLCQKRVLYVGGRTTLISRYRDVVNSWNGEFLHHDGGQQQSFERLGGLLEQADVVVFPADCVSHAAVDHIKNQCRQSGKPMKAVRSSGLGAFMSGLQDLAMSQPTVAQRGTA